MAYLLVTGTDWSRLPEYASSFPSWSCGFDSRRPLQRATPAKGPADGNSWTERASLLARLVRSARRLGDSRRQARCAFLVP